MFFAVVTILMTGLMSIQRQSSPWWQGSTSMFTGQWMKTVFTKVRPALVSFNLFVLHITTIPTVFCFVSQESCWMDSGDSSHLILCILSKMRRRPLSNTGTQ